MTDPESSNTNPAIDETLPLPEQADHTVREVPKAAILSAAAAIAVGGVAAEASQAKAADTHQATAPEHIQPAFSDRPVVSLESPKISLEQLHTMRPKQADEGADAAKRVLASAEKRKFDTQAYTLGLFNEIKKGKAELGFYNGIVVADSQVEFYEQIDPELVPYLKNGSWSEGFPWVNPNKLTRGTNTATHNANDGKYGAGQYPGIIVDKNNLPWLVFSYRSMNFVFGSLENQADPNGDLTTTFVPMTKHNLEHLKFYQFAGYKNRAFVAGGINPANQEFYIADGGNTLPSNYIAAWLTTNPYGKDKIPSDMRTDHQIGLAYGPKSQLQTTLNYYNPHPNKPWKPSKIPGASTIKKQIHQAYLHLT